MSAEDRLDTPGLRIVFSMPISRALDRWWTWREVFDGGAPDWLFRPDPPYWLLKDDGDPPEIEWHDPLLPIEYRGRIDPRFTNVAVDWVSVAGGHPGPP